MERQIKKLPSDISASISAIDEYLGGKRDFMVFMNDMTVRRAVEREFEIIGEATSKILKLEPNIEIDRARAIVDMRNVIIHAYDAVDPEIIWKVIVKDLPVLEEEVKELMNK